MYSYVFCSLRMVLDFEQLFNVGEWPRTHCVFIRNQNDIVVFKMDKIGSCILLALVHMI